MVPSGTESPLDAVVVRREGVRADGTLPPCAEARLERALEAALFALRQGVPLGIGRQAVRQGCSDLAASEPKTLQYRTVSEFTSSLV